MINLFMQQATPTPVVGNVTSQGGVQPPPPIVFDSGQLVLLVAFYVLLLVFAVMAPVLVDIFKAYQFARETRSTIVENLTAKDLDAERLRLILTELDQSPPGIPGLGRSTMAFAIILILGAAVLHLLVIPAAAGNSPVVGNVLSLLGGALASIIGFYFGGKTSQESAQQVAQSQPRSSDVTDTSTGPLTVMTNSASLPHARVNQSYQTTLRATGGAGPYRWSIQRNAPQPLQIDENTGVLSFTPIATTDPTGLEIVVLVTDATNAIAGLPLRIVVDA
jgi:hypothetical protein